MAMARDGVGVAVLQSRLYVVGGDSNGECLPSVECYDPATGCWSAVSPLKTPRAQLSCVVLNDLLFAIGGVGPSNTVLR